MEKQQVAVTTLIDVQIIAMTTGPKGGVASQMHAGDLIKENAHMVPHAGSSTSVCFVINLVMDPTGAGEVKIAKTGMTRDQMTKNISLPTF